MWHLDGRSWLVRWAYFMSDHTPASTNLCNLFWRSILLAPLAAVAAIASAPIMGIVLLCHLVGERKKRLTKEAWDRYYSGEGPCPKAAPSAPGWFSNLAGAIGELFDAMKQKACPVIRIDGTGRGR